MIVLTDIKHWQQLQKAIGCEYSVEYIKAKNIAKHKGDANIAAVVGSRALVKAMESIELPSCKLVQLESAGFDNIDIESFKKRNIVVCNAKGIYNNSLAEYVLFTMLLYAKRFHHSIKMRSERPLRNYHYMTELAGKTVGIMGVGSIGTTIAKRLSGFDMNIIGFSRKSSSVENVSNIYHIDGFQTFLSKCDFLINILPQNNHTIGLLDAKAFASMKNNVVFINIGRESIYVKNDLIQFMRSNKNATAILDIYELPIIRWLNPLRWLANVKVFPRIAAISQESGIALVSLATKNLLNNNKSYVNKL